jgi:hypothetical protein
MQCSLQTALIFYRGTVRFTLLNYDPVDNALTGDRAYVLAYFMDEETQTQKVRMICLVCWYLCPLPIEYGIR